MLGLQGTSSSSKVYRCMACSSTFTGLASLLVHQATHAAAISSAPQPPSALPSFKPHQYQDPLFAHRESSHHQPPPSSAIVLFESPSDSLYICSTCGDEFKDFNLMLEHKRVHLSNPQPRDATNDVRATAVDPAAPPPREPPGSGGARPVSAPTPPPPQRSGDPRPVSAPPPQRHALAAAELQSVSSSDTRTPVLDAGAREDAAAPRERSRSPRRPPHEKPDGSSAVRAPSPSEATQDLLEPVPDISEAIQHMSDAIQEMSEAIQDRPKPVPDMPKPVQDMFKPIQDVPEAIQDMPKPVPDMPEAIHDRPKPVQVVPEARQDMSDAIQEMSEAIQDRPEPVKDVPEAIQDVPEAIQEMPKAIQEDVPSCIDRTDSVPSSSSSVSKGVHLPKNNNFMKLLATAYMRRFPRVPPPETLPDKKPLQVPKAELVPVEITQEEEAASEAVVAATPLSADDPSSVSQLRQLLKKPKGAKTKSPGVGRILDSSTKSIVSLTKSFSPVVLLETRQTLVDPTTTGGGAGGPGGGAYQCCRCRRVFRDVDALTEHHSMHRKERIKCCRHCKKLIIGKMPFPDNHVCPALSGNRYPKTLLTPHAKSAFAHLRLQNQQNQKRVFFCPTCKHSYARRYNLKMHKCRVSTLPPPRGRGPVAAFAAHQKQTRLTPVQNGGKNNRVPGVAEMPILGISKSVGTEMGGGVGRVKVEPPSVPEFSDSLWSGATTAKSFPPFFPQAVHGADTDPSQSAGSDADTLPWDGQDGQDGQWTVPLDEEMEALSESDLAEMEEDVEEAEDDADGGLENSPANAPLPFFVSNGVKRYPCGRCQKTYSRQSTLRRHLMLCGARQAGPVVVPPAGQGPVQHFFGAVPPQKQQQHMFGTAVAPPNKVNNKVKPMFDCYVCGKSFNRKDNMLVHRNKCELNRTVPGREGTGTVPGQKEDGGGADGNNWGIMSLPSVLPRRVTCECGMGFTSPRLLLEHLQKHAQENYTCPTCGETVGSWADYEVHLQIHMHPHHQLYPGGLQPRRSQPLLLRFQQQPSASSPRPQPPPPPRPPPQPKQQHHHRPLPRPPLPPLMKSPSMPRPAQQSANKSKQRFTCTRCNNTFSSRCSLRRHVQLNRCKGSARLAANLQQHRQQQQQQPKTTHCTRCNASFPSTIALVFHQRSGACCKPTSGGVGVGGVGGKPMRCQVCARWFGSAEGLQRHMLSSHSNHYHRGQTPGGGGGGPLPYRCDVCDGSYPNLKSLKNHRRRVHRIMAGDVMAAARPKLERLLVAESV